MGLVCINCDGFLYKQGPYTRKKNICKPPWCVFIGTKFKTADFLGGRLDTTDHQYAGESERKIENDLIKIVECEINCCQIIGQSQIEWCVVQNKHSK